MYVRIYQCNNYGNDAQTYAHTPKDYSHDVCLVNSCHFLSIVAYCIVKGILSNAVRLLQGYYLQALHYTRHTLHSKNLNV